MGVKLGHPEDECKHCARKIIKIDGRWYHEHTRIRMCKNTGKEYAEPK